MAQLKNHVYVSMKRTFFSRDDREGRRMYSHKGMYFAVVFPVAPATEEEEEEEVGKRTFRGRAER